MKTIFINYRRADSWAAARGLHDSLVEAFGDAVFMDVDEIRVGDTWPNTLNNALDCAQVLLVVIGQSWLRMADAYGRRRLDLAADWVRTEIEFGFTKGITVMPILVSQATLPPVDALPASIGGLVSQQHLELRETHWKQDIAALIDRLSAEPYSFPRTGDRVPYPEWRGSLRPDHLPRALTTPEVEESLLALVDWKVETSPLPGQYPKTRTELMRRFRFDGFEAAMAFMHAAMPCIIEGNHHPRWENVFRTVTVWLSTWDSGHVISRVDLRLAQALDEVYKNAVQSKG